MAEPVLHDDWIYTVLPVRRRAVPRDLARALARPSAVEDVADALDRMGVRTWADFPATAAATRAFRPRVGPVLTARYVPRRSDGSDARFGHAVIAEVLVRGDIVLMDASTATAAPFGGNAAGLLRKSGAAAVVVDGPARDREEIETHGLPTLASRWGVGRGIRSCELHAVGSAITCFGVTAHAGDVALLNRFGMTLIPGWIEWAQIRAFLTPR